jgi:4-amino-4-deoxy-L-arabinose transferase-like glycosyltransferase
MSAPAAPAVPRTLGDRRVLVPFRLGLLALGLATLLVLLAGNASTSVLDRDEARFALAVREMRQHGEIFVPANYGEPRYHKPILAYWLALAAERVFGPGEFAWRFPSAVCGLLTVLMTACLGRDLLGPRAGLRAGAILATSLLFVLETKILTADAALLASTTLCLWSWMRLAGGTERPRLWRVLFWSGVGLGLLAKGVNWAFLLASASALAVLRAPPARPFRLLLLLALLAGGISSSLPGFGPLGPLIFAAAVALISARTLRTSAGRRAWKSFGPVPGFALAAGIAAIWGVSALLRTRGAFLLEGVGRHMIGRTVESFEGHRAPPGYYVLTLGLTFFPWVAFLPTALAHARRVPRLALLVAWIVGPWLMLELMTSKLQHYLLFSFPAMAVLVALEWERRARGTSRPPRWLVGFEVLLLALPCLLFAAAGLVLRGLEAPHVGARGLLLAGLGVALTAALAWARLFAPTRAFFRLAAAGATGLYLVAFGGLLPAVEPLRLAPLVGAAVARAASPGETVHLLGYHPASVGCYLPEAHPIVEDQAAVAHAIATREAGLFVVPNDPADPRFDRLRTTEPEGWEHLDTVRGIDFPRLEPRELWIVRRSQRQP